jgi:ferredoxin-thioredoxin reductase catalytic subunit
MEEIKMNMETNEGMKEYIGMVLQKNNWILIKDQSMFNDLINGLVDNKKSMGYQSCPCRLASGNRDLDRDLICPCDYASDDVKEFGACYCNLYLRSDFYDTFKTDYVNVPERRPIEKDNAVLEHFNK